ncbi:DnaJ sub C member 9 [Coelomomyces lativittatus]|nr:DnaJ sub C member 9 [Coelomomyces lativittatus]KAJ1504903.1 DnaJ sub C member 9 [Coelomomyces lativittatus]
MSTTTSTYQKMKGSEEEQKDLKQCYLDHQGDMTQLMDTMICSTHLDEPRFRAFLQSQIEAGTLPAFKNFTHEPRSKIQARQKRAEKEAKEALILAKELGISMETSSTSENDLNQLIQKKRQQREDQFDAFLDQLAEKYTPPSKNKRKQAPSSTSTNEQSTKERKKRKH